MLDSLRSRLVLSNLFITLLGLLIIVVVFTQLLATRSRDLKESERQSQARDIAAQVHYLYAHNAKPGALEQLVVTASRVLGARIIIYGKDEQPRLDSAGKTPFYTGTWKPLNRQALRAGQATQREIKHSNSLFSFQSPIQGVHGPNGGAVLLIVRVTEVRPALDSLAFFIVTALATALLVWLLIGLYFTYSMSRPLLQIMHATEQMARGRYGVRVRAKGQGEIARLGASFNAMAEQVQHSNQVLKDFVANVSHDLRTPLTMVSGYSQALLDGTAGPDETEAAAVVIHEEADKMQRMVDDLLQLTRLESGLFKLERQPVHLRPFVDRLLERVQLTAGDAPSPELRNLVPATLPPADVDPVQMERTLRNLLENAIQYTPASGSVAVEAQSRGRRWIEISVADTGVGIAEDSLTRIFERFYRSDRSREGRGHSGLGLAIVREIVESHGGRVTVESTVGAGTIFRLMVPAAESRPTPENERQPVVAT